MREGRRQRLGLQEGTEGTVQDTYLDRILEEEGPRTLDLGDDAFVDTRDNRYVQDAYNYYLGGGKGGGINTATVAPDFTGGQMIDTGGGGGGQNIATGGVDTTPTDNLGFDADVTPGPSGFIGLDPDMDVDPFEYTDYGTDDPQVPVQDPTTMIPQLGVNMPPMLGETGGSMDDMSGSLDAPTPSVDYSEFDDLEADPGAQPTELGSRINQAFENVKNQGIAAKDSLTESFKNLGGQKIADNLFKFGDTTIDIGKSLASGTISFIGKALTGIPGLGLIAGMLPEGGRSEMSDALGEQYGMDDIGRLTGGPMAGYNVDSIYGDIRQTTIDRINARKENNLDTEELEQFLSEIDYLGGDPVGANTDIDIDTGNITGDASVAEKAETGGLQGALDARNALAGVETGDASVAEAIAAADRASAARAAATRLAQARADQRGGGGGYGGGNKSPGHPSNR